MPEQLLTVQLLFWWALLALYVYENIRRSDALTLVVSENRKRLFSPRLSANLFRIGRHEFHLLNLLTPHTVSLTLPISPEALPSVGLTRTNRMIRVFQRDLLPFRWISWLALFFMLLGTVFTAYFGSEVAVMFVLPAHFVLLLTMLFFFVVDRDRVNLSSEEARAIFLRAMVLPAYMACLARTIAQRQRFACDGYAFSIKRAGNGSRMREAVARRIDRTASQADSISSARWQQYKSQLLDRV